MTGHVVWCDVHAVLQCFVLVVSSCVIWCHGVVRCGVIYVMKCDMCHMMSCDVVRCGGMQRHVMM